jgi:nicotinamide-nucleotide amidase
MIDPRRAALIAIGDELIEGAFPDTNSGVIAQALAGLGISVERACVVGDDALVIERTIGELCRDYQIVVATGGLGPTRDDVTRHAAAAAAGVPLESSCAVLEGLRAAYATRGASMPEANLRQALFPVGAQIMANRCGSAPGFRVWVYGGMLAVLPGPPEEMRDMLERELLPWLESTCGRGQSIETRHFFLVGVSESHFADLVGDWMDRDANPLLGVTSHVGVLRATLRATGESREATLARLEERARAFRERFEADVFSEEDPRPAFAIGAKLIDEGLSIATAESCTGGLVAKLLTDVPGVSAVFREGWVTYTNQSKHARLGVPRELLERHGAVSAEVAAAMAAGAARASGARLACSITGIAGPDGGTPAKPVGLVHYGLCFDGEVTTHERRLPAVGRETVRTYAAHMALNLLWRLIR